MLRVGMYIKSIRVTNGIVSSKKPRGTWEYLEARPSGKYTHRLPGWSFQPGQVIDFKASGTVLVHTLHRDEETGKVYDFKQYILSKEVVQCEVRQFFNKGSTAYVYADLVLMK